MKIKLTKLKLLLTALFVVGFAGLAFADGFDLTFKSIKELPVSTAAPAAGDLDVRYVAADNKVEAVSSTANKTAGSFNGTVGATTPSTGVFTTVEGILGSVTPAAATVTTGTVNTALVSKVSNDFGTPFSTGLLANPVAYVAKGSCTVAAVNGGTCIPLVGVASRTVTVTNFDIIATGSAATCTGVLLEDTNGSPVVIATLAAATLTSGSHNLPLTATLGVGYGAGSGLTVAKGVQIIVNGSGCTTTTVFSYEIVYTLQ